MCSLFALALLIAGLVILQVFSILTWPLRCIWTPPVAVVSPADLEAFVEECGHDQVLVEFHSDFFGPSVVAGAVLDNLAASGELSERGIHCVRCMDLHAPVSKFVLYKAQKELRQQEGNMCRMSLQEFLGPSEQKSPGTQRVCVLQLGKS